MADIIDLKEKTKYRFAERYPILHGSAVPTLYEIKPIITRQGDIKEYETIFWHRLLRNIYHKPLELEVALLQKGQELGEVFTTAVRVIIRHLEGKSEWELMNPNEETALKIQSKEIIPIPMNWKYFINLPSGGVVEIGTKDNHTVFYLAYIVRSVQQEIGDCKEAEKFVELLLAEANRLKDQLFNPIKEFERKEGLKEYHLFNVYLSNYVSGKLMLDTGLSQEIYLSSEFKRYDSSTSYLDQEKREHIDKYMLACGMYFSSAITYFFMALEGFINIVFHAFFKKGLRDKTFNIETNINNIEVKLKLMPALCSGFKNECVGATSEIYSSFSKLKKYRNSIFHSKVEDSLKIINFTEDNFMYSVNLGSYKKQFMPSQKIMLTDADVLEVQRIVDEIITMILDSMTENTKKITERYILKSPILPFYVLKDGAVSLGMSEKEQDEKTRSV